MTATNQNATVYAGDYLEIEVPVLDPSGGTISPAGMTARYKVGKNSASTEALISKDSGGGIVITTVDGTMFLTITLDPADTASLPPRSYYHEVEVTDIGGRPFTVMIGHLEVVGTLIK